MERKAVRRYLNVAGRRVGPDEPPYVIAEISGNHNGQLDRATVEQLRQPRLSGPAGDSQATGQLHHSDAGIVDQLQDEASVEFVDRLGMLHSSDSWIVSELYGL